MPRQKQSNKHKEEANVKQQVMRDFNAFIQMVDEERGNESTSYQEARASISAPPEPEKNFRNPDGLVDVVTFCEHPYFLNLRLTPWQKLILKLFYCGSPGNIHLSIDDTHTENCEGCIWSNCREAERRTVKDIRSKKMVPYVYMPPENSRCLQCKRYSEEDRQVRFDFLKRTSLNDAQLAILEPLFNKLVEDKFTTEKDLFENDLEDDVREQIRGKIGLPFQELILVLGRRSGKSFMVSVIALYEVYKLLMMVHPQSRYALMEFDTITLLNVATSETVARSAIFIKIKNLVETSPYFIQYIGKNPTSLEILFLTDHDKEENIRREKMGVPLLEGTIELRSGHSQSATLLGGTICTVIIDEMAAMAKNSIETEGVDETLYAMLKPSLATFGMDGKMICISNPLGPTGKFYKLYQAAFVDKTMLMVQLATWQSNPTVDQLFLESERIKDPENFGMHYGAQFGVTGMSPLLPEWAVNAAFEKGTNRKRGESGYSQIQYFAHLDPAFSSDNYTLVVLHLEPIPNMYTPEGKQMKEIVVDYMHFWQPRNGFPVDSNEVDSFIIELATKYKFTQISYDHWGSQGSITKLRNYGLNVIQVTFSRNYQNLIFQEMYEMFINQRIDIYNVNSLVVQDSQLVSLEESKECRNQLLTLQKKWRSNNTYKIEALRGGRDDFPDCIAAAAYEALKFKEYQKLARPKSVYTGHYMR